MQARKTLKTPSRPSSHEPTEDTRRTVIVCASIGTPHSVIAAALGIGSVNTLKKYYKMELRDGLEMSNARVAETLFRMALSGRVPAATFFWLKTRAGWRETTSIEHSGSLEAISDEERVARVSALLERARDRGA